MNTGKTPSKNKISVATDHRKRFSIWKGWLYLIDDVRSAMDAVIDGKPQVQTFLIVVVSIVMTWFIYVPIHELFHVAACIVTGGSVEKLVMGREYGAVLLKPLFPFIEPQTTAYAGRLTDFTPNGDWGYFATDFGPFILTLFPGVYLLRLALKRKSPWLLGPGAVVGLAPFSNLTGDYFEMGSILSTRIVHLFSTMKWDYLVKYRSDDIFRLLGEMAGNPGSFGIVSGGDYLTAFCIIVFGGLLAILGAGWTYHLGRAIALRLLPDPSE